MEKDESDGAELHVAVGLSGSRKGKQILKWALDKFQPEGNVKFTIVHVYSKIIVIPTPMGTWLPIAQVPEGEANTYRKKIERKKKKALLPHQQILTANKVKSNIVVIESDNIAMSLCLNVDKHSIRHLVVGPSSTSIFSRKNLTLTGISKDNNLPAVILGTAPSFCSVYVVGDGKLQNLRPSESEPTVISIHNTKGPTSSDPDPDPDRSSNSSSLTIGRLLKSKPSSRISTGTGADYSNQTSKPGSSEPQLNNLVAPKGNGESENLAHYTMDFGNDSVSQSFSSADSGSWVSETTSTGGSFVGTPPPRSFTSTSYGGSFVGTPPRGSYVGFPSAASFAGKHMAESTGETSHGVSFRDASPPGSFRGTPAGVTPTSSFVGTPPKHPHSYELETLKMKLRHVEEMYELAQNNSIDERLLFPLNQLNTLSKEQLEEALKELKMKEKKATNTPNMENNIYKDALHEAESSRSFERSKPWTNKEADAVQKVEDNENKLQQLLASPVTQYQKFCWNEIVEATSSLSEEFKIGAGAFGTVYKCKLNHTTVAVKVLHSKDTVTNKQFLQELEILSTIRHPHILLLLGAVPEQSCLVYEYMENGSLEDRLFQKGNRPVLSWYERVRVCWEMAVALDCLHSTKPRPIIHRDLKPANILLDQHFVSKIGDAGLGTTINMEPNDKSMKTLYKETSPVGTLCYIDPEYQRTGRVSTKSDIYALGVVMLQLLTTKSAVGVAYLVEDAIDEGTLMEVLDKEAGEWPEEVALELASLGLLCSELRGRDRPDLRGIVLPTLDRLKEVADNAREQVANAPAATPAHFICHISKDVMDDPYVAADGYTYNRAALEKWLAENNTSPTTNLPLSHKFIMPNNAILEAIKEWKSKQPRK